MSTRELVTTTQLAQARGVSRQAILAAVGRGTIKPALTLANGNHLFKPDVTPKPRPKAAR